MIPKPPITGTIVLRFCMLAGLCDGLTGLLLVIAPNVTLGLMGIEPTTEPILIRFIGVFVGGIGAAYWHPWWGHTSTLVNRETGLRTLLEITALCRIAVGLFVTVAILQGALALPWWLVAATDLALASAQLWTLRQDPSTEGFRHA